MVVRISYKISRNQPAYRSIISGILQSYWIINVRLIYRLFNNYKPMATFSTNRFFNSGKKNWPKYRLNILNSIKDKCDKQATFVGFSLNKGLFFHNFRYLHQNYSKNRSLYAIHLKLVSGYEIRLYSFWRKKSTCNWCYAPRWLPNKSKQEQVV